MAKKNSTSKRGPGRPPVFDWNKVNLQWKNKTNREIADMVGCSVPNVFNRRKKLIEKAEKEGKNADFYRCKLPKYTRAGFLAKAKEEKAPVEPQEAPVASQEDPVDPQEAPVES